MQHATPSLSWFSAIAASILVASVVPAACELDAIEPGDHPIEAIAPAMALAELDPTTLDSRETEDERAIDLVPNANGRIVLSAEDAIIGIASFYDDPQETASGEQYDPDAFTAAAQLEIRGKFGRIQFGRLYQPAYGLGEYGGKKIIVRFNDVGPLRPGRKFDLSRAAMAYFDSTLDKGLLPGFKMTPLPLGRTYPKGPVTDEQLADLGIDDGAAMNVCDVILDDTTPIYTASIPQSKPPAAQTARADQSKLRSVPPVIAKPGTTRVAAKAAARPGAKSAAARPAPKTAAARANVKVAVAVAPKGADQAPAATPWIKRVWNWITSPAAGSTPAQPGGASDKRRVVAQAR